MQHLDQMTPNYLGVLELLGQTDLYLTPQVIAAEVGIHRNYANEILAELFEYGLVETDEDHRGLYKITTAGSKFLDGDLSPEELRKKSWRDMFQFNTSRHVSNYNTTILTLVSFGIIYTTGQLTMVYYPKYAGSFRQSGWAFAVASLIIVLVDFWHSRIASKTNRGEAE